MKNDQDKKPASPVECLLLIVLLNSSLTFSANKCYLKTILQCTVTFEIIVGNTKN